MVSRLEQLTHARRLCCRDTAVVRGRGDAKQVHHRLWDTYIPSAGIFHPAKGQKVMDVAGSRRLVELTVSRSEDRGAYAVF